MRPKGTTKYDYSEIKEFNLGDGEIYWTRPCPQCKKEIKHKCIISVRDCHRHKRKCNICGNWNRGLTIKTSESLRRMGEDHSIRMKKYRETNPPWNKGLTQKNNEIIKKITQNNIGFKHKEETKTIIGNYSKKMWSNDNLRNTITNKIKKYYNNPKNIDKLRYIMEQNGHWTSLSNKTEWEKYKQLVWSYTRKNDLSLLENFNKRGRIEIVGSYSLDHKYSVSEGFRNKVSPKIMGSIHNLEFIESINNDSKKRKCSITKEKLLELYGNSKNKI
jgi:hypothetical protein